MKTNRTSTHIGRIASTVVLLATLAACATNEPASSTEGKSAQEIVTRRANERWKLLVARKFEQAYNYASPGFKALVKPEAYQGRFGAAVVWTGAEAINVSCAEEAKCVARIRLDFKPVIGGKNSGEFSTHFDEIWLQEDGQWWKYEDIKGN